MPSAVLGGILTVKTGRYKPYHIIGFSIMLVGLGTFTILDAATTLTVLSVLEVVLAAGSGLVLSTVLPGVQADLPESDVAVATGAWAFMRSFGTIWGISIPAAIFDNRFNELLFRISDPTAAQLLQNGAAYMHASKNFTDIFSGVVKDQVISVYSDSLQRVWQTSLAFAAVGLLLAIIQKEVKLRKTLDTDFGLVQETSTSHAA
jgi:hypothetical protein